MIGSISYGRMLLATAGGFVAYFAFGFLVFGALPLLRQEYAKFPAVYRDQDGIKKVMPIGMAAMFVAMLVLAYLYATAYHPGYGPLEGAYFGALLGLFAVCSFVLHNHVNLNIGWALTCKQAIAYFAEWTVVGTVIGWLYRVSP
jgi:Protein of unknown function (DUF1761)